jgi:pentose-5-phosphate-3-epimerase/putative flippase GtrA
MRRRLARWQTRLARICTHTQLSYTIYRYRYLAAFTLIGMMSIVLEVELIRRAMPVDWPWQLRACLAFVLGMLFSFVLNATVNFRVPRPYLLQTFGRFVLVSTFSFALNMAAVYWLQRWIGEAYGAARLTSAGLLFLIAYALHRRYTFDRTRSFGIAVYASSSERVFRIFYRVGRNCNHLHVDLVDSTMNADAAPVDLQQIRRARRLWPATPLCLHVMSYYPRHWVQQTWDEVDWYLFHVNAHDDLARLILECRLRDKRVGVVWHTSAELGTLLPVLGHVDFVAVLGIAQPGQSGQPVLEEAIAMAAMLDRLRERYGFEVIFDGGVNAQTITRIRAKYVVAASAVLRAPSPIRSAHCLQSGAKYEPYEPRVA